MAPVYEQHGPTLGTWFIHRAHRQEAQKCQIINKYCNINRLGAPVWAHILYLSQNY